MKNMDAFKLENIAIIGMILSHTSYAFWDRLPDFAILLMNAFGGLTFIITSFLLVEGYRYTKNIKKYILRLCLFGLIATPFHMYVIGIPTLNVLFTLAAGLGLLWLRDKFKHKWLFWVLHILIIVPISFFTLEFYAFGVTTILLYHVIKNEKARRIVPALFMGGSMILVGFAGMWQIAMLEAGYLPGFYIQPYNTGFLGGARTVNVIHSQIFMQATIGFGIVINLSSILISMYNGERGKKSKYKMFFYWVYPGHLAILALGAFLANLLLPI
ncbi:MAG: conjugal transfer protein TraX [Defluviitaleaceae bacterium]|nr:conjugal transfer protein TraX [Defluviitaleaceae bacterium]